MIFKTTANALKGQNHQRRATPCDWRTETIQALKGRKPIQRLLSPFQGFHPHVLSLHRALPDANAIRLSAFTTVTSCLFFIPEKPKKHAEINLIASFILNRRQQQHAQQLSLFIEYGYEYMLEKRCLFIARWRLYCLFKGFAVFKQFPCGLTVLIANE